MVSSGNSYETSGFVYVQSFHFDFPPESVIAQISLSTRADNPKEGLLYRLAQAYFSEYTTADGETHDLTTNGYVSSFVANNLTGFSGYLAVGGCWAEAIINVFVWPSVYS
jgi:hypothetical protein